MGPKSVSCQPQIPRARLNPLLEPSCSRTLHEGVPTSSFQADDKEEERLVGYQPMVIKPILHFPSSKYLGSWGGLGVRGEVENGSG